MIGVSGATMHYRVAVAELPLRARTVDEIDGAIVVVDGSLGWPGRARAALQQGASALLVADPLPVDDRELAALEAAAGRVPVVLDRCWLRADVTADAVVPEPARQVTVDAVAIPADLSGVVCAAIGWLRVLAGGELELRAATALPHGVLALLEEPASGRSAAVTASALVGRGGARLRANAIGETRVEVDLDDAADVRSVEVSSAEGTLRRPRRHESGERVALRRAIDAASGGSIPADLRAFRHDSVLAARILAAG